MKQARQSVQDAKDTPWISYLYGVSLEAVGRHEEALAAYQEELRINPGHKEAGIRCEELLKALSKPVLKSIPTAQRSWHTSLPRPTLLTMQQSLHNYHYRGVPMLKNPFDTALYPQLLWKLKPRTVFEIGSKSGGSALWMGDMVESFHLDTHIHSLDIVRVTDVSHPRVTFWEGDGRALEKSFSPDFLQNQPRPWLVIEDADHTYETSSAVLKFFDPWLKPEEYIVVEDGIISDLVDDPECNSGPHRALKEFLSKHSDAYEIDGEYCDFFGYNMTWCTNGFLRKKANAPFAGGPGDSLKEAERLLNAGQTGGVFPLLTQLKGQRTPTRNVDLLRAKCFIALQQPVAALEAAKEELRYFPDNEEAAKIVLKLEPSIQRPPVFTSGEFQELYNKIAPFTMVGMARLNSLYELSKNVCQKDVPGSFVECGVAAGGSSALLATVIKRDSKRPRKLFACDTFTGMPDASLQDTHGSVTAEEMGWGAGTCAATVDSLNAVCEKLGVMEIVEPVQGLFADTLPKLCERVGPIAFLHMDGDWYASTRDILENLFDQVVEGGVIQIDDYGYWDGCKRAIKEFEEKRGLHFNLHTIDDTGVWMIKTGAVGGPVSSTVRAVSARQERLLNLGCGAHFHPDWVNVDIAAHDPKVMQHDLQLRLPFEDASFAAVYHSHVLEHLPRWRAEFFLKECYRVLATDGILRLVVPDLETITRLYLKYLDGALAGDEESARRHDWMTLELLDQMTREESGGEMKKYWRQKPMPAGEFVFERMGQEVRKFLDACRSSSQPPGESEQLRDSSHLDETQAVRFRQSGEIHKWMYDRWSLRVLLEKCGFSNIVVCSAADSRIPNFGRYHLDVTDDGSIRKPDSLFMEAIKP